MEEVIRICELMGLLFLLALVSVPISMALAQSKHRTFMRKLRERGQVREWGEVESLVSGGAGTLIVEFTAKGPGYAWFIDRPRDEVDPEHVLPSWQDVEKRETDLYAMSLGNSEVQNRWNVERFRTHWTLALVSTPTWSQLSSLKADAKREAVFVVSDGCQIYHRA